MQETHVVIFYQPKSALNSYLLQKHSAQHFLFQDAMFNFHISGCSQSGQDGDCVLLSMAFRVLRDSGPQRDTQMIG